MADQPRLVIFDCDGTLVDSQFMIGCAMETAFEAHSLTPPPLAEVRHVVGLSLEEAIGRLAPDQEPALVRALSQTYASSFRKLREGGEREPLYPGARQAIEALYDAGYLLDVATGKSRRGLDAVLAQHGLDPYFITLQTADQGPGKPHPAMVQRALAEAGVDPAQAVMVGDTSYDMEMARAAKTSAIGVAWGYHQPEMLMAAGAQGVLTGFDALVGAVVSLLPKVGA